MPHLLSVNLGKTTIVFEDITLGSAGLRWLKLFSFHKLDELSEIMGDENIYLPSPLDTFSINRG